MGKAQLAFSVVALLLLGVPCIRRRPLIQRQQSSVGEERIETEFGARGGHAGSLKEAGKLNYVVLGAGPVGLYFSYALLKRLPRATVTLLEKRADFSRPQVIRIPFIIAKQLPEEVSRKMWADPGTYTRIFQQRVCGPRFFPHIGYEQWPFINVSEFQKAMQEYLTTADEYKHRFLLKSEEFSPPQHPSKPIQHMAGLEGGKPPQAVICTCGTVARTLLRNTPELKAGKEEENKGLGIYWILRQKTLETYCRGGKEISFVELGKQGVTYAASNNLRGDVQIYTYAVGRLEEMYRQLPDSLRAKIESSFKGSALLASGRDDLTEQERSWLQSYVQTVKDILRNEGVVLNTPDEEIKLYSAERKEYYFNKVTANRPSDEPKQSPTTFFLGDSAGSTDYKMGLSGGRGLLAADKLASDLALGVEVAADRYQKYWDEIIEREFNKPPTLTTDPLIKFMYMVLGRTPYLQVTDYAEYLEDIKQHNLQ